MGVICLGANTHVASPRQKRNKKEIKNSLGLSIVHYFMCQQHSNFDAHMYFDSRQISVKNKNPILFCNSNCSEILSVMTCVMIPYNYLKGVCCIKISVRISKIRFSRIK